MRVILGGVRGTSPVADKGFLRYGGETTSVLVEGAGGERVLLDAGTGLRVVGSRLDTEDQPGRILLLLTHYHLDHLLGLPSFSFLYKKGWTVEMASPVRGGWTVEQVITRILGKPFWPVQVTELQAAIHFTTLSGSGPAGSSRSCGGLEIRWCSVCHPEGCTAYRIDEPATGGSLVLATDLEWGASTAPQQEQLLRLLKRPAAVDVLLFDGNYSQAEYEHRRGWGHSTWEDAVAVARQSGARQLLITHHDPEADDEHLAASERRVAQALPGARLARGGMEIVSGA